MKRILRIILLTVFFIGVGYVGWLAWLLMRPIKVKTEEPTYFYIPTSAGLEDVLYEIQQPPLFLQKEYFERVAKIIGYNDAALKPGRYKIPDTISYLSFARFLKRGIQTPVNVVLTNERTPDLVAGKVQRYLESDSMEFLNTFRDPDLLKELGYTEETLMCMFIPNTYQFMWNTPPEKFLQRMKREWETFWNKEGRLNKAQEIRLTPNEVYTLASIVEKESQVKSERPTIAGLYLNRLREGIKLQADPTVVFATGDFTITRVLLGHLAFDSPYNTYLYEGLPPGPIAMASINSIDAVLNAERHDYIYMCAAPDMSGRHVFASDYKEHVRNANIYRAWLDKMNIK